jgi:lipopolysaccharide/colanic/teichoic acid biosynthesis glycosyltransferase
MPPRSDNLETSPLAHRSHQPMQPIAPPYGFYFALKPIFDRCLALLALILVSPIIAIAAIIVRLTSPGKAFYTQVRLGKDGKPYVIYKLRSMYQNCESSSGIKWSSKSDSRVTRFGWFMRSTHIDELPQLWNICRGEMSFIGPRPERPEIYAGLDGVLPEYRQRMAIRPGLTGLSQIQLPPDSSLETVRTKLARDRVYISYHSFWLDFKIVLATGFYLAGVSYNGLTKLFQFPIVERRIEPKSVRSTPRIIESYLEPALHTAK